MEWVETTGRTVAEAIDRALDELGVHLEDLEYHVLAEPRAGFLGRFGGGTARIRARVKPVSREKPGTRRRRPRRPRGGESDRHRSAPQHRGAPQHPTRATETDEGASMDDEPTVPIEEQVEETEAFLRGLVEAFGIRAVVRCAIDGDAIAATIEGDQLGLLIGPRGVTLTAIEELSRAVLQRCTGGHSARLVVDVEGYRQRRRAALERFTRELAEEVLTTGQPHALDPMAAPDRKVVHDVAASMEGVETISEGDEPRRYVVIRRA